MPIPHRTTASIGCWKMLITDLSISIPGPVEIQAYDGDDLVASHKLHLPQFVGFDDKNDDDVDKKGHIIKAFRDLMLSLRWVLFSGPHHEDAFAKILPKYFPDHQDQRVKNLFKVLLGSDPGILGSPMIESIYISNDNIDGGCKENPDREPAAYVPTATPFIIVFCPPAFTYAELRHIDCKGVGDKFTSSKMASMAYLLLHELM